VCKKLAELEDKFNNKLKDYATRAMVKQDIEDMKAGNNSRKTELDPALANAVEKSKRSTEELLETKHTDWAGIVSQEVSNKMENVESEIKLVQKTLTKTQEQASEAVDHEQRRNNIVLYNVPEDSSENADERYKADLEYCCELVYIHGAECNKEDIKRTLRLGRREDTGRNRPLLVEFRSRMDTNIVMESLSKLRNVHPKFNKVIVVHDLTRKEHAECKTMVKEAKKWKKRLRGEYTYRVQGNRAP